MNGISSMVKQLDNAQMLASKKPTCIKTATNGIIRDYKKGASAIVLAQRYGISKDSVYKVLKTHGVYKRRVRVFDKSLKLTVVHERLTGKKTGYLAEKYGIAASTVSKWVNQHKEGKL